MAQGGPREPGAAHVGHGAAQQPASSPPAQGRAPEAAAVAAAAAPSAVAPGRPPQERAQVPPPGALRWQRACQEGEETEEQGAVREAAGEAHRPAGALGDPRPRDPWAEAEPAPAAAGHHGPTGTEAEEAAEADEEEDWVHLAAGGAGDPGARRAAQGEPAAAHAERAAQHQQRAAPPPPAPAAPPGAPGTAHPPPGGATQHDAHRPPAVAPRLAPPPPPPAAPPGLWAAPREDGPAQRQQHAAAVHRAAPPPPEWCYLFLCSHATQHTCQSLRLLASPGWELAAMRRIIRPGCQLFLLNYESRHVFGPLAARGTPDLEIVPEAFGGRFEAQVLFEAPEHGYRPRGMTRGWVSSGPKTAWEMQRLISSLLPAGGCDDEGEWAELRQSGVEAARAAAGLAATPGARARGGPAGGGDVLSRSRAAPEGGAAPKAEEDWLVVGEASPEKPVDAEGTERPRLGATLSV